MIEWSDGEQHRPNDHHSLAGHSEAGRALADARRLLAADANAAPDVDDLVEVARQVAAVAEDLTALNNLMIDAHVAARQRGAR